MEKEAIILTEEAVERTLLRLAHQILEKHPDSNRICFVGIQTRGVPLAQRLANHLRSLCDKEILVGELDITLYRDDRTELDDGAHLNQTDIPFSVTGERVILVDDVLFTARTARAAIDAVLALGRPCVIQLAVLVDRGHVELPIKANFVGKNIPSSRTQKVAVRLKELDGVTNVCIYD